MIIVYASNTGYTKEYAEILSRRSGVDAFSVDDIPRNRASETTIFMGWIMAGKVMGYNTAKMSGCNIKCVVGVGMSPEGPNMVKMLKKSLKKEGYMDIFYLQGGYDYKKLKGIYKLLMKIKSKEIIGRFDGMSEADKEANATYRMVTRGDSVVSEKRIAPVIAWVTMHEDV